MNEYEDEFVLIDYLNILWKRKWLIIIPTFFLVIAVGIISFLLPKKWEIDAILVPGKFLIQDQQGEFEEIMVVEPKQIANQINEKSYDHLIAAELNLDIREFPKLKAENLQDTKLVQISIKENDIEQGKVILHSLFNHLNKDLDKKIDVEMKGIDTQIDSRKNAISSKEIEIKDKENAIKLRKLIIEDRKNEIKTRQNRIKDKENAIKLKENAIKLKENATKLKENTIRSKNLNIKSKEIEKKNIEEEINTLKNKFEVSQERSVAIVEEMKDVKSRVDKIEKEQRKMLKRRSNKDALSMLLYSNEVQNNLRYFNALDEKLSNEKITKENINLTIEEKKTTIRQVDVQIEQIRTQIDDVETGIEDIGTQIDNIRTEIDDVETQIDDIGIQIDNVNNEIRKINNEIDTIKNGILIKKNEIENVRNDIAYLQERKGRIDYTQLVKEPTSSLHPVSPKKILNVLIAGILGMMVFTMLAFFLESLEKHKAKIK